MPYFERQQGGLCRKHAINNFLGREELKTGNFYKLCDEYDGIYSSEIGVSSRDYDYFAEGRNVNGYYLEEKKSYLTLTLDNKNLGLLQPYLLKLNDFIEGFFVFNENHIWTIKRENNSWLELDSLKKPIELKTNNILEQLEKRKRVFYTIIFKKDITIKLELEKSGNEIVDIFKKRLF